MAQGQQVFVIAMDSSQEEKDPEVGGIQDFDDDNEVPAPLHGVKTSILGPVVPTDESNAATDSSKGAGGDANIAKNDVSAEVSGCFKNIGGGDSKAKAEATDGLENEGEAKEEASGELKNLGGGDAKEEASGELKNLGGGDAKDEASGELKNLGGGDAKEETADTEGNVVKGLVDSETSSSSASKESAGLLQTKEEIKEALIVNSRIIEKALEVPGVKKFLDNLRALPNQNDTGIAADICKWFSSIDQFMDVLEVAGNPLILKVSLNDLSFLVYGNQRFPDPISGDDEDLAPIVDLLWKLADREFDKEESEPLYFGDPAVVARCSELLFYFERQIRVLKFLLEYNQMEPSEQAVIAGCGMDYEGIIKNRLAVLEEFLYETLEIGGETQEIH